MLSTNIIYPKFMPDSRARMVLGECRIEGGRQRGQLSPATDLLLRQFL